MVGQVWIIGLQDGVIAEQAHSNGFGGIHRVADELLLRRVEGRRYDVDRAGVGEGGHQGRRVCEIAEYGRGGTGADGSLRRGGGPDDGPDRNTPSGEGRSHGPSRLPGSADDSNRFRATGSMTAHKDHSDR
ncbi:hypothetical protein SMALB_7541 [Streptomyces malaysiensis]|uniref:Uncharacterized protein n=1 Tax=Streptomyces malaysiensis TaxID=92644 RepID=A0A7X5XA45_STRMQ|nr:hypothetical protein [Streptomyces malaysiensis]